MGLIKTYTMIDNKPSVFEKGVPVMRWDGSAWVRTNVYAWNGSSWVLIQGALKSTEKLYSGTSFKTYNTNVSKVYGAVPLNATEARPETDGRGNSTSAGVITFNFAQMITDFADYPTPSHARVELTTESYTFTEEYYPMIRVYLLSSDTSPTDVKTYLGSYFPAVGVSNHNLHSYSSPLLGSHVVPAQTIYNAIKSGRTPYGLYYLFTMDDYASYFNLRLASARIYLVGEKAS